MRCCVARFDDTGAPFDALDGRAQARHDAIGSSLAGRRPGRVGPAGAGASGEAGPRRQPRPSMGPSTAPHPAIGGRRVPPCLTTPKEVIAAHNRVARVMTPPMLDVGGIVGHADHEMRGLCGQPIPRSEALTCGQRQGLAYHSRSPWLKLSESREPCGWRLRRSRSWLSRWP